MCAISFVLSSVFKAVTSICIALGDVGDLLVEVALVVVVGDGIILSSYFVIEEMSGERDAFLIILYLVMLAAYIGICVAVIGGLGGFVLSILLTILDWILFLITDIAEFLADESSAMYEYFLGVLVNRTNNMGT